VKPGGRLRSSFHPPWSLLLQVVSGATRGTRASGPSGRHAARPLGIKGLSGSAEPERPESRPVAGDSVLSEVPAGPGQ